MMIVLLACMGLAIDGGNLFLQKRRIQTAADSGAMAALITKNKGGSLTQQEVAAKNDSALNGFTDGVNNVSVSTNASPTFGPHVGNSNYVEVVVTQNVPVMFMRVLGFDKVPITARAEGTGGNPLAGGCIFLMRVSGQMDWDMRVAGTLNSNCNVKSNGTDSVSMLVDSGSATAPLFTTVGGTQGTFSGTVSANNRNNAFNDPLPSTLLPEVSIPAGATVYNNVKVTSDQTLNPGVYNGGIQVMQGMTATLNPGLYVMKDGDLYGQGGPNTAILCNCTSSRGVTIYFTSSTSGGYSRLLMDGQTTINLQAPTTTQGDGSIAGVLFMQDRSHQGGLFDIQGSNTSKFEGIIYIPGADLLYQNQTTNSANYTVIVARTLALDGGQVSLQVKSDYSAVSAGPLKAKATIAY